MILTDVKSNFKKKIKKKETVKENDLMLLQEEFTTREYIKMFLSKYLALCQTRSYDIISYMM